MQAEIITIGDELLIGQVVDTNSAWLGRTLGEDGIKVTQITSIQDDADQISRTVNEALARVSIVLVTGGLGPTRDDITKHTLAELFGMRLVRDEQVYETVRRQLAVRGIAFNELNRGQALVPDGCTVLPNRNGTAPGMWFERGGKILVSMPGASDYFLGGVVAYSNEVKTALLGVDPDSLNRYGAVSRSVAEQMAEGVRRATGATYGISTTGIAGPTGGTPGKPVGTVWMAVATPEGVHSRCMVFGSVRAQNIERSSSNCINLLRLQLLGFGEPPLSDNI